MMPTEIQKTGITGVCGRINSEDIDTLTVGSDPEGRSAPSPVFVAGIEHSLIAKVVIANQALFFSADRTGMSHFVLILQCVLYFSTECHIV
jgi:hypothetical protein